MKTLARPGRRTREAGLTLLEMVVVMAILAALTTLAIRMTSGVANQGRYEATEKTLTAFRTACIGAPADLNSGLAPQLSSFVADLGRLPQAIAASGGALTLDELHGFTANLPPYAFRVADSTNTLRIPATFAARPPNPAGQTNMVQPVRVPSGWRGPYIYLGSSGRWIDGWGKNVEYSSTRPDWVVFRDLLGTNITTAGSRVAQVEVANGASPGYATGSTDPYAVGTQYSRITRNEIISDLVVQVRIVGLEQLTGTGNLLQVRLFGPNPGANSSSSPPIQCLAIQQAVSNIGQPVFSIDFSASSDFITWFTSNPLCFGPKVVICEIVNSTGVYFYQPPGNNQVEVRQITAPISLFFQPGINYVQASIALVPGATL